MNNEAKNVVFLDVRNNWEYRRKHLENSILIPFNRLQYTLEKTITNKEIPIVIFCSTGERSKVAADYARKIGYKNIIEADTLEEAKKLQEKMDKAPLF